MGVFKLKPIIFSKYFGSDTKDDVYKDSEGKGTNQRFQEILAEDWDTELIPLLDNILDNTIVPETVWDRFVPYLENMLGLPDIIEDLVIRRKLIKNALSIYKVKGTLRSYELLYKILGFTSVAITTLETSYTFDSPVTFDDAIRRFDTNGCPTCSSYELHLTTNQTITDGLVSLIVKSVIFVEPINARLKFVVINGEYILIRLFINASGDLIYVPATGTDSDFKVTLNGDLAVDGSFKEYVIRDGNLIML